MCFKELENICLKCEGQCRMTHKGGCAFRNLDNSRCDDYEKIENMLKENQKLKKKYENAVSDYETAMAEKEQLNSLVNNCQEKIRKLKKELDKYENPEDMTLFAMWCTEKVKEENKKLNGAIQTYDILLKANVEENQELKKQQKEFIRYLEEKLNFYKINAQGYSMNLVEDILQKYKSIIGDDKQ